MATNDNNGKGENMTTLDVCPKCDSLNTNLAETSDGYDNYYAPTCGSCGFSLDESRLKTDICDEWNAIKPSDILDDCEMCGGHYDIDMESKDAAIGNKTYHRAVCGCGASGSWTDNQHDTIEEHNTHMETLRDANK